MSYLLHLCIFFCIYFLLVQGLNTVIGFSGRLLFAQYAFFGTGAYASALALRATGGSFVVGLAAGVALGALAGWLCAIVCAPLSDEGFVLATLGVHVVAHSVMTNWVDLTGGPYGLTGIPVPTVGGVQLSSKPLFATVSIAVCVLGGLLLWTAQRSPFGRSLLALREDEVAFRMLGNEPRIFISDSLVICGGVAGAAGALYAGYVRYVDPTNFTVTAAILVVTAVVVGGSGTFRGGLVGTLVIILLPEFLRLLPVSSGKLASTRDLIFGLLIVVFLRFRPRGILGRYPLD